jgi:diguanylate cyclase (GGDEF)-like protein/PAS domain S-box-containing protein
MPLAQRLRLALAVLRGRVVHPAGDRAQAMLDAIGDAVVAVDAAGHVTYMNRAAETMTGWASAEAAGRPARDVMPLVDRQTRTPVANPTGLAIRDGQTVALVPNCLLLRRDGRALAVEDSAAPIRDPDGQVAGAIIVFRDVGASLSQSLAMAYQAQHDALTTLPNRAVLNDRLSTAVALARRRGTRVGVCFIDVDGFKNVNDTYGHTAADRVLTAVARRLRRALRASDTVGRYGGDEFVVVLPALDHVQDAVTVVEAVQRAMATPHQIGEQAVTVSASIGVSVFPDHAEEAESLLARADAAMYEAKRAARGTFRLATVSSRPSRSPTWSASES